MTRRPSKIASYKNAGVLTIYVPLEGEGTDVWRPVQAKRLGGNMFRIIGPMPDDEVWRFAPGAVVTTRARKLTDGSERIAAAELSE